MGAEAKAAVAAAAAAAARAAAAVAAAAAALAAAAPLPPFWEQSWHARKGALVFTNSITRERRFERPELF